MPKVTVTVLVQEASVKRFLLGDTEYQLIVCTFFGFVDSRWSILAQTLRSISIIVQEGLAELLIPYVSTFLSV